MTNLIAAYQRNEILEFEKILKVWLMDSGDLWRYMLVTFLLFLCWHLSCSLGFLQSNRRTIMDDPFIRNYIEDLLKNVRTQVLLKLIKPYTRIRIPFISKVKSMVSSYCCTIVCNYWCLSFNVNIFEDLKTWLRILTGLRFSSHIFLRNFYSPWTYKFYWLTGTQRARKRCWTVVGFTYIG
jgi:hypothetical protein